MKVVKRDTTDHLEILEILSERDEDELKNTQQAVVEFLRKNTKISDRESLKELVTELEEVESLKQKHILKLLELLPTHVEELDSLFSKERLKLSDAEKEQIIEICSSYSE